MNVQGGDRYDANVSVKSCGAGCDNNGSRGLQPADLGAIHQVEGMLPDAVVSASPPAQAPAGGIIAKLDPIIATLDAYAASARVTQPNRSAPLGRD